MSLLSDVVGKTDGGAILLVVILAAILLVLAKPMYKLYISYLERKERSRLASEANLLEVIKGNSTILSELKTLLTSTNENCRSCKQEQIALFRDFDLKLGTGMTKLGRMDSKVTELCSLVRSNVTVKSNGGVI